MTRDAAYDAIAGWYDAQVRAGSLLHDLAIPALFDLAGPLCGLAVCDLACGQGIVARQCARRGARVTGIDLSRRLLAIAARDEQVEPLGIRYCQGDAQTLDGLLDGIFDGVLCNLALMDIPDLAATFAAVRRVLKPGGWFIFAITHPCFETPASAWLHDDGGHISRTVRGYFADGFWRSGNPDGVRGRVGAYHRTLTTYANDLAEAGFSIERLIEPRATQALIDRVPGYAEVPPLLVARCRIAPRVSGS